MSRKAIRWGDRGFSPKAPAPIRKDARRLDLPTPARDCLYSAGRTVSSGVITASSGMSCGNGKIVGMADSA